MIAIHYKSFNISMSDSNTVIEGVGAYTPDIQPLAQQNEVFYNDILAPTLEVNLAQAPEETLTTKGTTAEVRNIAMKGSDGSDITVRRAEVLFNETQGKAGELFSNTTAISWRRNGSNNDMTTLIINDIPKLMPDNPNEKDIRNWVLHRFENGKPVTPTEPDKIIQDLLHACNGAKVIPDTVVK